MSKTLCVGLLVSKTLCVGLLVSETLCRVVGE